MSKKKQPKKPFYVENMTVKEILNITPETLATLDKRDISRALRTVSLAANKRLNRLKNVSKKTKDGYIPKAGKVVIATDALNYITKDGSKRTKFGVKQSSTRNQMIKQINDIKKFMDMKTSTISGAIDVRRAREKRLFGETSEQSAKSSFKDKEFKKTLKGKTKKQIAKLKTKQKAAIQSYYEDRMKIAYRAYRHFLEVESLPNAPYEKFAGSDAILSMIGNKVLNASELELEATEGNAWTTAVNMYRGNYEKQQEEFNNDSDISFLWEM